MTQIYCMNCGSQAAAGARFCAGCGAAMPDTEVTRVAAPRPNQSISPASITPQALRVPASRTGRAPDEMEKVIFTARPTMLFIGLGYAATALAALLLIILLALPTLGLQLSPLISVPLALSLLLIPAYYHLRRNSVRYTLTDSKIEIDRGFLSRTTSNMPLRNIQNVTVTAGLMQRLLGFGDVLIDDASEQPKLTVLHNIPHPRHHADLLLRELRRWR